MLVFAWSLGARALLLSPLTHGAGLCEVVRSLLSFLVRQLRLLLCCRRGHVVVAVLWILHAVGGLGGLDHLHGFVVGQELHTRTAAARVGRRERARESHSECASSVDAVARSADVAPVLLFPLARVVRTSPCSSSSMLEAAACGAAAAAEEDDDAEDAIAAAAAAAWAEAESKLIGGDEGRAWGARAGRRGPVPRRNAGRCSDDSQRDTRFAL